MAIFPTGIPILEIEPEGATILISNYDKYNNAYDIAVEEYNQKKIPFIIRRPFGNIYEYWKF